MPGSEVERLAGGGDGVLHIADGLRAGSVGRPGSLPGTAPGAREAAPGAQRRRGLYLAVLGVAYAVLLAFVVIVVWEQYEEARDTVETEANELAGIYFLADRFSDEAARERVQELARSYARTVVEEEWSMMERGETSETLRELRLSLLDVEVSPGAGEVLYDQGLTRLHEVSDARRLRLLEVTQGLPGILWVVLMVGGVVTVGFTYLFGLKSNWAHALMVAALTLVICGILFTIGALEYPFAGLARVEPTAFDEVLRSFEEGRTL